MQNKQQKVECGLPLSWLSTQGSLVQFSGRLLFRKGLGFMIWKYAGLYREVLELEVSGFGGTRVC